MMARFFLERKLHFSEEPTLEATLMRTVEYHRYWVTAPGRKRPYLTSFPLSAEEAVRYPGARPEPSTRQVRQEPETDEERGAAMYFYQSAGRDSVQPPRQNADMNDRRTVAAKSLNAFFGKGPAEDLSPALKDAVGKLKALTKDRPGLAPLVPLTGLLAGRYLYIDHPGQDVQLVDVTYEDGDAVVRFLDAEEEDAEVTLLARDMSGEFRRV